MLPPGQSLLQVEKGRNLVDSGQFFRSGSTLQCKTTSIGWHITVSLGSACNFLWEPVDLYPTVMVGVLLGAVGEFVKSETSWDGPCISTNIPHGNIRNENEKEVIPSHPHRSGLLMSIPVLQWWFHILDDPWHLDIFRLRRPPDCKLKAFSVIFIVLCLV